MSAACPRLGFDVRVRANAGGGANSESALRATLVDEIGRLGLECVEVPSSADAWTLAITRTGSQAEDGDRQAIADWLARHPGVEHADVGPLYDLGELE